MSFLKHCADGNLTGIKAALKNTKTRRDKVQIRDNHNWTCLHHAVKSGNVECIKYLLSIKELDTTCETFEGETALHIACSISDVSLDIVTMLIEANPDLVHFVNNEDVDLLQCAIQRGRLDIVQVLIANGCPVNKKDLDGDTPLHIAAIESQMDIIRYLLYEPKCDPMIRNNEGADACALQFSRILYKLNWSLPYHEAEFECFEDLARFTFDLVDMNKTHSDTNTAALIDLNEMISLLYYSDKPRCGLYTAIVNLFHVPPSKQYFFDKILESNVSSCHCLITGLLKDDYNIDDRHATTDSIPEIIDQIRRLSSNFLLELYMLLLSDEPFFQEYISEFMSTGWKFSDQYQGVCQIKPLYKYIIEETKKSFDTQKMFTFLKTLLLYGTDLKIFFKNNLIDKMPPQALPVFMSLVNLTSPEMCLARTCSVKTNRKSHSDVDTAAYEVFSLKNLCRMTVRRYYLRKYSHYDALKALYSLNVPWQIRQFLSYNFGNWNF